MAQPGPPPLVKLICGMISASETLLAEAITEMEKLFGPTDVTSETMPFDFTHYYDAEMGSPLLRKFVAFNRLVSPDVLPDAKVATNDIERRFAERSVAGPRRPINLDVGYIEQSKLVLASMKNFSHRIYLCKGVYADLTLMYRKGLWEQLPWTFPDYASGRYFAFLNEARGLLHKAVEGRH